MLITATPTIQNGTIQEYLEPVFSHIVLGTNMFSDIAASWRDVFGGRSQSYQTQLERLSQSAMTELAQSAKKLGANAIVGMKMDYSDISGGGKSMLMVVATGTAVKYEGEGSTAKVRNAQVLDSDAVDEAVRQLIEIRIFRLNPAPSYDTIVPLIENRVHHLWDEVLEAMGDDSPQVRNTMLTYFAMCAEEKGYKWLLDITLKSPYSYLRLRGAALLSEHGQFMLSDIEEYLSALSDDVHDTFLSLASLKQEFYYHKDVVAIRSLAQAISDEFSVVIRSEEKTTFTGKKKTEYSCPCGAIFDTDYDKCGKCGNNKWGFKGSGNPDKVVAKLEYLALALELLFEGGSVDVRTLN